MIAIELTQLIDKLNGQLLGENKTIRSVSTDSRKIPASCLFIALTGERFDGHDFANIAVDNGAIAVLVERQLPLSENISQLIVSDCHKALGEVAAWVKQVVAPLSLALTGSNGKTTVKEMVTAICGQKYQTRSTLGNFNNDIGVPLTLLQLEMGDQIGVFELGANHAGEIDYTSSLVKPDIALVNNVASAHLEGFGSEEGVARAKSEIFHYLAQNGTAIINLDDDYAQLMQTAAKGHKQLTFSINKAADVMAKNICSDPLGRYQFTLLFAEQSCLIQIPLMGKHQVNNALAAASMCLAAGFSLAEIATGLTLVNPVAGRMQPNDLGRISVIDDSYNANPASVSAAINWLKERNGNSILVLGDLAELGDNGQFLHAELGLLAKAAGINEVFCCGSLTEATSLAFGVKHYHSIEALTASLLDKLASLPEKVTILVKGSRSARMERVVQTLMAAYQRGELV